MKLIAVICVFLSSLWAIPTTAQEPTDVSMVQLIANPEKYDGKLVRVIGFLRMEFEGNALYLHREDYEKHIAANGIWVDVTSAMNKQEKTLNSRYDIIEGVFSSSDHGHLGMFSGALKKISRAELWDVWDHSK
jgi:hypothetical protein